MTYRTKLIEVSLPLEAISEASVREKSIRHGHPSTLHLWWSRKPLAASRAVLFASLVDDPSAHPDIFDTEEKQATERERLFSIMRELIKWENSNNDEVLQQAREEILKSADGSILPPFLDPFAGGGSIPLEAQRLGLESYASDLNPVAVLLNKALIELPPRFANMPPINPEAQNMLLQQEWKGAQGLANDIRYYGKWMRDEAEKKIGQIYPRIALPGKDSGEATVIAWLWVRTITCPNPACGVQMPLTSKWWLSKKGGKEVWVEPKVDYSTTPANISFNVRSGKGKPQDGTVNRQGARCIACQTTVPLPNVREQAKAGKMSTALLAIVAEGTKGRIYLPSNLEHEKIAYSMQSHWKPTELVTTPSHDVDRLPMYGMYCWGDAFSQRQLVAITTFSDLIQDVKDKILNDASNSIGHTNTKTQKEVKYDFSDYANSIVTYLALAVDRLADRNSTVCSWDVSRDSTRNTFARQAISMVWDFAEANPFSDSTGNFIGAVDWITEVIELFLCATPGTAIQHNATSSIKGLVQPLISTDPPYYDNVGYADLSDFFYVWLRHSLYSIYPDLFNTMLVPKTHELVVTPHRYGGSKQKAQKFFEDGLHEAFKRMREVQHPAYPLTIYYAFKQAEAEVDKADTENSQAVASTGWETMLTGLIDAGFTITGTWPMRTEMMNRSLGQNTNALASSIVLVCRPRPIDAPTASRRQFINELRDELEEALRKMQHDGIAPVDLAQASIGPGMKVYSQYRQILESNGSQLSIRTALQLINRELDSILAAQEGEYDIETRWAIAWFGEHAMEVGLYGQAETFSKAKNISLHTLTEAGLLEAKAGKVRLLKREELAYNWQPEMHTHRTLTTWEVMQRMLHALDKQGTTGAGAILASLPEYGDAVRELAYHLYNICERKGWSVEGQYFNMLVISWPDVEAQARIIARSPQQSTLSFD